MHAHLTNLSLIATAALLAACGGRKDDSGGTPVPFFFETADTADAEPYVKYATELRIRAYIAWDAVLGEIIPPIFPDDPNGSYISVFVITLYEKGWSAEDDLSTCNVRIDLTGYPESATAQSDGWVWGVDIPEGDKEGMDSDCISKGFDPSQWTDEDPINDYGLPDWQLRLGGGLTEELQTWLTDVASVPSDELIYFAGGDFSTDTGGLRTDPDDNYWWAYETNDSGLVDFDAPIDVNDMVDVSGNLVSGMYYFDQRVYWTLTPGDTTTSR